MERWNFDYAHHLHNTQPGISITASDGTPLSYWTFDISQLTDVLQYNANVKSLTDACWHPTQHSDSKWSTITVTATRDFAKGEVLWQEPPMYVNTGGLAAINGKEWLRANMLNTKALVALMRLTPLRHQLIGDVPHYGIASIVATIAQNMYSVMGNVHLYPGISYMNHSCDPNVSVCCTRDAGIVIALKPIRAGDTLTVNYYYAQALTEKMSQPDIFRYYTGINCQCGHCHDTTAMQVCQATIAVQDPYTDHTTYCANCHTISNNLMQCGGCRSIRYCHRNCQTQHWPVHKEYCPHARK